MKLNPHLSFGGRCEEAFQFYQRCFGGEILSMLTYGNSPMAEQVPQDWRGKIAHATLTVGDSQLMVADVLPEQYEKPKGFQVLLAIAEPADAERIFETLSKNGTVHMPLPETYWSVRFGVLVDQFDILWEINCGQAHS